jgi:hypothetical protein
VKGDEMGRACSDFGGKRDACTILVGKPEGERPLARPTHRWEHNIKMDLGELGWGVMHWIDVAQDRDQWRALVNMLTNLQGSKKFWKIVE